MSSHSVLLKVEISELIHLDSEGFDELVDEAAGGVLSAYTVEVEDVEDNTLLVLRVHGELAAMTCANCGQPIEYDVLGDDLWSHVRNGAAECDLSVPHGMCAEPEEET